MVKALTLSSPLEGGSVDLQTPCFKFPKEYRLLKRVQFKRVFEKPQKCFGGAMVLFYRDNGLAYARLGLAVTKRNIPKAVERNRLRRIIRESFRVHGGQLKGFDIVVLPLKGADTLDKSQWVRNLRKKWAYIARQKELVLL